MTVVLLILLGIAIALVGIAIFAYAADRHLSTFTEMLLLLLSLCALTAAVIVPLQLGGVFDGPSDPCRYTISVKPVVYGYHHGPIQYGGRTVLCP